MKSRTLLLAAVALRRTTPRGLAPAKKVVLTAVKNPRPKPLQICLLLAVFKVSPGKIGEYHANNGDYDIS